MFPIIHKTKPFIRALNATSLDGGVTFLNVPPGDYILEAKKDGMTFSKVAITARKGVVVNASHPNGPTKIHDAVIRAEKDTNYYSFFKPLTEETDILLSNKSLD